MGMVSRNIHLVCPVSGLDNHRNFGRYQITLFSDARLGKPLEYNYDNLILDHSHGMQDMAYTLTPSCHLAMFRKWFFTLVYSQISCTLQDPHHSAFDLMDTPDIFHHL